MKDEKDKDDGDYLGYGVYADTLWNRIQAALNKDQGKSEDLGDDPLVVGIFGEWGAGKSTLLKLVRRRAEKAAEQANKAQESVLTVPVYFQPWKYEHEKHLLVPLVLHVVEAAREALKKSPTVRQQLAVLSKDAELSTWKWGRRAHETAKTARKWFPVVKKIVGSLSVFGVSIALPDEIDDWLEDAEAVFESPEAKEKQRNASAKELRAKKLSFVDNGFHYYELHELLTALTRPGNTDHTEDMTAHGTPAKNLRINFVIFIDDLDRCLPEKAVETLELIKTVFNLESFAFVLALDEEVVERGIGHRYKDYALQNKKPEMPITGFEYLEKIVHLPFRLPGLTRDQARRFLHRYEEDHVAPGQPDRWWFAPRPTSDADDETPGSQAQVRSSYPQRLTVGADLTDLVLSGFAFYVPRKLVRLVELLHQVQEVAARRGKTLTAEGTDGADARVVATLLMIQLFQPDLYRLVRRKPQAFPLLLAAFATRKNGQRDFPDPSLSDVDLWLWVVEESVGEGNEWVHTADLSKATDAAVTRIARSFHEQTQKASVGTVGGRKISLGGSEERSIDLIRTREHRFRAQNVKLPLVVQVLEHRAAQRHSFDPLLLFHALAGALEQGWDANTGMSPALQLTISDYFELLVARRDEEPSQPDIVTARGPAAMSWSAGTPIATQLVRYPDRLFADLTSDQPEVQANLVANNELEPERVLDPDSIQHLLDRLKEWRAKHSSVQDRDVLIRGLVAVSAYIPRNVAMEFFRLVDDQSVDSSVRAKGAVNEAGDERLALMWSALKLEFDLNRFDLPRLRWGSNTPEEEPLEGFVRVLKGEAKFRLYTGRPVTVAPFAIARYLTTVDQFAHFVNGGGYGDPVQPKPDWWDTVGWQWRIDGMKRRAFRRGDIAWKMQLAEDIAEGVNLSHPVNWSAQIRHGTYPVLELNWFEARAYAAWLTIQLRERGLIKSQQGVRLPTEAEWELVGRSSGIGQFDERRYPTEIDEKLWGLDPKSGLRYPGAPMSSRSGELPAPKAVGSYRPNALGVFDLCGNAWELQNNACFPDEHVQDVGIQPDLNTATDPESRGPIKVAIRGGVWSGRNDAPVSLSNRSDFGLADWHCSVGFRLLLTLSE